MQRIDNSVDGWSDEAIAAFWRVIPVGSVNLTRAQTVKALNAAIEEQSKQMSIQRNKRLAERYNWIPPDEL